MTQEDASTQCPKFGFKFTGKCCNKNCMLWHVTEGEKKTSCLQLDAGVVNGLTYTQAKNSALLMQLSLSEDPKIQLDTSQRLLRMAMVLSVQISQFEPISVTLCECGARKDICQRNGACKIRRDWFTWLGQLFNPLIALNSKLTRQELHRIFIQTLMQFHKSNQLPPFIEQAFASLSLSKRIL